MSSGIVTKAGEFKKSYNLSDLVLGQGSYATVQLGVNKHTGEKVAVKILQKLAMSKKDIKKVEKEVTILKSLRHKNIVRVFDAYSDDEQGVYYIVMEYAEKGDLFKRIVDAEEDFSEEEARDIMSTLVNALKYCRDKGVIHRDIKPDNILIGADGVLKIADFNLSKILSSHQVQFTIIETQCGTPNYGIFPCISYISLVAPEVLSGKKYGYKCDIWSVGVILFLLLSGGYLPFFPDDEDDVDARQDLLDKVRAGKWTFEPTESWEDVSAGAKDLVTKMLTKNPSSRLNYEAILSHPWMNPKLSKTRTMHLKKAIDTSSMTILKEDVEAMKSKRGLKSTGKTLDAAKAFGELMTPGSQEKGGSDESMTMP